MNSYQAVKNWILSRLQKRTDSIENKVISKEIQDLKNIILALDNKMTAKILQVDKFTQITDKDWIRIGKELEDYFDVKSQKGTIIQGKEQQFRDTLWWSNKRKQECDNHYWNRYKEYISNNLIRGVVKTLDDDTDQVMNNIENPQVEEFSRYGMVVGHVQSGKTSNYISLICKAADAGYKFIVVIAGGINNLRNQTQKRLNEGFIGRNETSEVGVGKFSKTEKEKIPISLTTTYADFNKHDAERNSHSLNFDNVNVPILLVIKKHTKTLDNVIEWLTNQYKNGDISKHSLLLIDDESDYASINTKDEDAPTAINKKIRKLLSLFRKSAYVAYTATPYANIFIDNKAENDDVGVDLFPKDFIYALKAPSDYFGAEKIFLKSDKKYLREINDYEQYIPLKHKKDFYVQEIPESLYEAMRTFIINIAVRCLKGQSSKHNSMLVHVTRFTMVHKQIATFVQDYIEKIKKEINVYGRMDYAENYSSTINSVKLTYEKEYKNLKFKWKEVLNSICDSIGSVIVREVHQGRTIPLEYSDDYSTNAVVIGGTSLSRGFTLEGLSISYFLRRTIFYDTLMQMGRWFGYRTDYEDLCKIYMTEDMIDNFELITRATNELFFTLEEMMDEHKTPNDFGLAVRQHPDSILQVTARNKQKNATDYYFEMNLDGTLKETSWIDSNLEIRKNNLNAVKSIVSKLQIERIPYEKLNKNYLWRDINKDTIIEFLDKFKVYSSDEFNLRSRMPIKFIKEYALQQNCKWDIAIYSGQGQKYEINDIGNIDINREQRKIKCREGFYEIRNRQVSSGNSEAIVLMDEERKYINSKREDIRKKMKKPLLMLHILEAKEDIDENQSKVIDEKLATFGVSFPKSIKSEKRDVFLKINTVFIKNLLEEEEFDD